MKKISELPAAGVLTGSELVEVVQAGASKKAIMSAIGDLAAVGTTGPTGVQGITGATGPTGPTGTAGTNGTSVTGVTGVTGTAGSTTRSGAGAPSNSLGSDGDFYINVSTDDLYLRASGTYSVVASLKGASGPAGATGSIGTTGAGGATGPTGATGAGGATGATGTSGTAGASGAIGIGTAYKYTWLTSVTDVDPAAGFLSGDDTPDSATYLRFSKTDGNANSLGTVISQWLSYSGAAYVIIQGQLDPTIFVVLAINKKVDHTTWWDLFTGNNGPLASNGTFTNNQVVSVQFIPVTAVQYEVNSQPANPTGTTDTTGKMMGLGHTPGSLSFTPNLGGPIVVTVSGTIFNSGGIGDGAKVSIRAGTGAAPSNGDALTGSLYSSVIQYISSTTAGKVPFSLTTMIVPVVANTTYWIDLGLAAITGGTANVTDLQVIVYELPS